jgi:NAD(P)-dependent dehydrogenase (short-subunit alcohol dehydrogenase family)
MSIPRSADLLEYISFGFMASKVLFSVVEFVRAVLFLACDEATLIIGAELAVDGGYTTV